MRRITVVGASVFLFCAGARAQQPPEQQTTEASQDQHVQLDRSGQTPVFRLTVVERRTQAVNYRHRSGSTPIGRQQNRRVEMVVSGKPIGVAVGNVFGGRESTYSER